MNIVNYKKQWSGKMTHLKRRLSISNLQQKNCFSRYLPQDARDKNQAQSVSVELFDALCIQKENTDRHLFIGECSDGSIVVELGNTDPQGNEFIEAGVWTTNNSFSACQVNSAGAAEKYDPNTHSGTLLLLAFLQKFGTDSEFVQTHSEIENYLLIHKEDDFWTTVAEDDDFVYNMCKLSMNIYYRAKRDFDNKKRIGFLRNNDIKHISVDYASVGSPKIFTLGGNTVSQKKGDILKRFAIRDDIPENLLPKMPEWYVTPQWVLTTCQDIKESDIFPQKYRNVLLTGPSGTGKTKGAQAMASCLGLPYGKVTCSPDSEIFEFIGQMLPNTEKYGKKSTNEALSECGLPTFDDVENDFEGTYRKLFGSDPGRLATPADCYSEIMRRALSNEDKADFIYVESDLIKAVRNGWFCELQEPTVIKRSSVLVGLNALFENDPETNFFTLPTGEIIKRHPASVICLTTNSDYEGCNNIQQSVLSRMDLVREIGNPSAMDLRDRTIAQTGFNDQKVMFQMADIILNINEHCEKNDITDGICGPRELTSWTKKAMLLSRREGLEKVEKTHIIEAAFSTLIPKVSQTKDDAEDVVTACLQVKWTPDEVMEAKHRYETGLV